MSGTKNFTIPSELRLTQKWDYAIANFMTRPAVGFAVGGIASLVLFRQRNWRVGFALFSAGIGFGDAYRLSTIEFEKEKALADVVTKPPSVPTSSSSE